MNAPAKAPRRLVVRFAGDSGDGVQLAGLRFATEAAGHGADLMTLPEYPAEIRAPAGTLFGVSAYQVQFGPGEVLTPGDAADLLVAFNPEVILVHGDDGAKRVLQAKLRARFPTTRVTIG